MIENPTARRAIYLAAVAAGAVLVALGVFDADVSAQLIAVIGGVLGIGVGGLAAPHVAQRPTIDPDPIVEALDRRAVIEAGAQDVEQARAELERRLSER